MKNSKIEKASRVWKRNEVESPCVSICLVHPTEKLCTGCFRTISEISGWSKMTKQERKDIMRNLPSRASKLNKRRGGRRTKFSDKREET